MKQFYLFSIFVVFLFAYILRTTYELRLVSNGKNNINEDNEIEVHYFRNFKNINHLKKNNKIFVHVDRDLCAIQRLCIKSLIFHYNNKHDIILYLDEDVQELIQESDEEDLCNIKNPNLLQGVDKKQWINYVKAKILYTHGGIVMEPYFFFTKYSRELFPTTFHVLHHNNEGFNVSSKPVIPYTTYFISSPKNDGNLQIYKEYLKYLCIHHYSEDHKHFDKTFEKLYALPYINPKIMGIVNRENAPIEVPQLLETQELHLDDKSVCLFIHIPFLKKYRKYGYLFRMKESEIMHMNNFLGSFIRYHE